MSRTRHLGAKITLIVILSLILAALGGFLFYQSSLSPLDEKAQPVLFQVNEGENTGEIIEELKEQDLIKSTLAADIYVKLNHVPAVYAGNYEISAAMSVPEILAVLCDPQNIVSTYKTITVTPGMWAKDVAQLLEKNYPDYSAQSFLDLWNDEAYLQQLAGRYPFLHPDQISPEVFVKLEGYLYPETYYMEADFSEKEITEMFLDQFNVIYQELKSQFDKSEMSVEEVVTLASMIQFESDSEADMKDVSSVFHNRLNGNMQLESSVTVCYAMYEEFDDYRDCEVNSDIDSPYNTYQNPGLPIGPILNPTKPAIEAALNPSQSDYLFFVADVNGDGSLHFAKTYEEHLALVEQFGLNY